MPRTSKGTWSSAWRLWPAPSVRAAVENLASREQRTIASTIERLIVEALHQRVAADPAPTILTDLIPAKQIHGPELIGGTI